MADKTIDQEWRDLAIAAQEGDKKSYNTLLRAIAPYIANFIKPSLSQSSAVDDVVQEVLISVHKSLNTYSPERPFKPWLIAIINFRKIDYLRKHYATSHNILTDIDDLEFSKKHVTNPTHAGELKDIEGVLDTLSGQQRRIFEMIKIEGYTAQEVANEMGMNVSAVKVSAHRTLKKIQDTLK